MLSHSLVLITSVVSFTLLVHTLKAPDSVTAVKYRATSIYCMLNHIILSLGHYFCIILYFLRHDLATVTRLVWNALAQEILTSHSLK